MLISLLCTGYQEEFQESQDDVKTRILSICQDIIFLSSRGHKLTPKHIGIGLTVHQATRSKQLVQLLHAAGHSVNYHTVLRMDNTIANDVLKGTGKAVTCLFLVTSLESQILQATLVLL